MKTALLFFKYTLIESFREPFVRFFFLFSLLLLLLSYYFSFFSAINRQESFLIAYISLSYYAISFFFIAYPAFKTSIETSKKMMHLYRSKPIQMYSYLLGRFFGFTTLLLLFALLFFLIALMLFFNDKKTALLLYYLAIILEESITIAAALFFGTFLSPLTALTLSFMFFFISHNTYEFMVLATTNHNFLFTTGAKIFYALFPSYDLYDLSAYVVYGTPYETSLWLLDLYSTGYCLLLLVIANRLLTKRELE